MARCVSPARGHPAPGPRRGAPSRRGLALTVASPPFRPELAAWTHLRLPGSGCGRLGASDVWTGQVRGRQELPLVRGPPRAGHVPAEGSPRPSPPWHRGGKPRRGGGRRGGQCQAGGLAFRCPLLGAGRRAGRPRSLGVPRLTAAGSRQLLPPALLPAPAPGRCALAFPTEHLDSGRLLPRPENWSGAGPRRGGVRI